MFSSWDILKNDLKKFFNSLFLKNISFGTIWKKNTQENIAAIMLDNITSPTDHLFIMAMTIIPPVVIIVCRVWTSAFVLNFFKDWKYTVGIADNVENTPISKLNFNTFTRYGICHKSFAIKGEIKNKTEVILREMKSINRTTFTRNMNR